MNKYPLFFFFIGIVLLFGCERDDICAESTPTTPNAIITFYDVANQGTLKSVAGLRVLGEGQSSPVSTVNVVTTDSIAIPLRTNMSTTTFIFHKNYSVDDNGTPDDESDDIIGGNPDTITITYDPDEIYVSRACGFKTIFRNFSITLLDDGDNWIQTLTNVSENLTIENEEQAHINITH
ncbi:MAG: hypothetical protein KJP09_12230 [Bacteroidia bacterium]|nr:hypothetical protein [Bacteroidia bacterium]